MEFVRCPAVVTAAIRDIGVRNDAEATLSAQ
jgi:hypothetical protein